jgi:2-polyprenyl-6-methoxyphenol hydroxylase-like FAD-dependent oxidoreductase
VRIAVVGAGPVGVLLAVTLHRRGHDVLVVDHDPGPPGDGSWERHGVMQFRHPHFFRSDVRRALLTHLPEAWDAVVAAGGVPALAEGMPEQLTSLACRRSTFERALHTTLQAEPGLTRLVGYAERVVLERDRVTGLVVDGTTHETDLVLDVSGRTSKLGTDLRPPVEGGACGFSYVSRMYRARPGAEPYGGAFPDGAEHDGYHAIVFPQDDGTHSTLVIRDGDDASLADLKRPQCYEAALAAIPHLAPWADPERFEPISPVQPGGGLTNTYRRQPAVPGLIAVGDSVSTTNPMAGRGVALGLRQADALLGLLDGSADGVTEAFQQWCDERIRPWYDDHVHWDRTTRDRWAGEDLDVEGRLPSDVICATAQVDPSMLAVVGPFFGMLVDPTALDAVSERARAVLRTGWRPPVTAGPSHDELAAVLVAARRG